MKSLFSHTLVVATLVLALLLGAGMTTAFPNNNIGGFESLELCQLVRGFAGTDHFQYRVNVNAPAFALRSGEGLVFVLRTPAEDDSVPAATITAVYTPQGGSPPITVYSDVTTGNLQLGTSIGNLESLTLTVINTAPNVDTPFVLYSYHANFPSCGIPVTPGKTISLPLISQLAEAPGGTPAAAYFALSHPPGLRHYSVSVLAGGNAATFSTSMALVDTASMWVPAPNTGVAGDLPADPTPSVPQVMYLKVTPSAIAAAQVLRFQVVWTTSAGTVPPAAVPNADGGGGGGNNMSPLATGVPGILPDLPGVTQATGTNPPTDDETTEGGSGGSILWSMFVFFLVVGLIYFGVRTAYNVSQGERDFPKMIPHHEQIGRGLSVIAGGINVAATKINLQPPFPGHGTSGGGRYDDIDNQQADDGTNHHPQYNEAS